MAIKTFDGYMLFPDLWSAYRSAGFLSMLLDAASEKAAMVFRVGKAGTITKVGFRTGTVTTGADVDVRLETVDASGDPSGTLAGTNTNATQTILSTDDSKWFTVTLTSGYAASGGEVLAVVIVNPSVSPGNLNIAGGGGNPTFVPGFPYCDLFTAAWAKQARQPIVYIEYSDGTTQNIGAMPVLTAPGSAFNSGSTPDERGNIFQLPFPVRVAGLWATFDGTAGGSYDLVLYDSDGTTVLGSVSHDADHTADLGSFAHYMALFATPVTLLPNTQYRVVMKPTTTTNIQIVDITVDSAGLLDSISGGQKMHQTTRTDAGSWTQTTTGRIMGLGLLIDGFEDGSRGAKFQMGVL